MNRSEAYAIAGELLDLAQDLAGHARFRDPANIKKDFSKEEFLYELKMSHDVFVRSTDKAYDLVNKVAAWADEYPLEKNA